MTDYTKLVEALRERAGRENEWYEHGGDIIKAAADAIEALQAQLPKRGKWIVREVDIPGEIHPVAFRCMCSMCRNEYVFPRIPRYCPDCGSMNTAKMEVQDG